MFIRPVNAKALSLTIALLLSANASRAVTILSGPSFTTNTNAPLAGLLQLTTDQATRVSVSVNEGTNVWTRRFYDYTNSHSFPLAGFKPGHTNQISVTVFDRHRNQAAAAPLTFVTAPLPTNFANIVVLQRKPELMEPGYTLFNLREFNGSISFLTIVDNAGNVVWYDGHGFSTADLRQLDNGDLFMPATTNFVEMNLLGQTVKSTVVPAGLNIDPHDGVPTDHGTILYLSDATELVTNYPSSMTVSNAARSTANVGYQKVVEISATNGALLNTWSPINVLDPRRVNYLNTFTGGAWDSEHCNAVLEDPSDDSIIVSMRTQNAVVKFSRTTGQLRWILGTPDNWGPAWQPYLLTPVGTPFAWQFGQHAPILTSRGTLIMWDNGNYRVSPFAAIPSATNYYSRSVEYSINEQTMEVSQVWEYGRTNVTDHLYANREGIAQPLPLTGNVLNDFAAVQYINGAPPSSYGVNATMCRITEVTHEAVPQVVFDLAISLYANPNTAFKDLDVYRSKRIPDLYAHPARPVEDLSMTCPGGVPHLEFSADDARSYQIQISYDLALWEGIGTAAEDAGKTGNYSFVDEEADGSPIRYYRVVTQ